MHENSNDQIGLTAMVLRQQSQHPWGHDNWSLAGVVPGLLPQEIVQIESQGELHIWSDLVLKLYPLHCEAYYQNLMSQQAKLYLVCQQQNEHPKPLLLTVDYDEAASYMETSELVLNTELPDNIYIWLEQFVVNHYQPQAPQKRRRKQWHNDKS